jgi:hypothetical protein
LVVLKSYVRNRAHPKGSIMEGYTTEEVVECCANYINIIIRYSEIIIENNYKYYNKEKYIIILNHITNIKTYLTFLWQPT